MYSVDKIAGSNINEYLLEDTSCGASAKVAVDRGGILTSFAYDGVERIYLEDVFYSDAKEKFRGGNPILFPSCGRLKDAKYTLGDKIFDMGIHGFAREKAWHVESVGTDSAAELTIVLRADEDTLKMYPFDFELKYIYRLKGKTLSIIQDVSNKSAEEMPFTSGMHPYFCADTSKACASVPSTHGIYNGGAFEFNGVLNANEDLDHVCMDLTGNCSILDTGLGYSVEVSYSDNYTCVVVWSPENNDKFVCVEPWTAIPNALNTKENLIYLAPGKTERLTMDFTIVG